MIRECNRTRHITTLPSIEDYFDTLSESFKETNIGNAAIR